MLMTCVCVSNFIDVTYLEFKTQVMKRTLEYNYAIHFQYSNDSISTDVIKASRLLCFICEQFTLTLIQIIEIKSFGISIYIACH